MAATSSSGQLQLPFALASDPFALLLAAHRRVRATMADIQRRAADGPGAHTTTRGLINSLCLQLEALMSAREHVFPRVYQDAASSGLQSMAGAGQQFTASMQREDHRVRSCLFRISTTPLSSPLFWSHWRDACTAIDATLEHEESTWPELGLMLIAAGSGDSQSEFPGQPVQPMPQYPRAGHEYVQSNPSASGRLYMAMAGINNGATIPTAGQQQQRISAPTAADTSQAQSDVGRDVWTIETQAGDPQSMLRLKGGEGATMAHTLVMDMVQCGYPDPDELRRFVPATSQSQSQLPAAGSVGSRAAGSGLKGSDTQAAAQPLQNISRGPTATPIVKQQAAQHYQQFHSNNATQGQPPQVQQQQSNSQLQRSFNAAEHGSVKASTAAPLPLKMMEATTNDIREVKPAWSKQPPQNRMQSGSTAPTAAGGGGNDVGIGSEAAAAKGADTRAMPSQLDAETSIPWADFRYTQPDPSCPPEEQRDGQCEAGQG